MRKYLALVVGLAILVAGCGAPENADETPTQASSPEIDAVASAFAPVGAILSERCIGCHGANGKEGFDFRTYESVMAGGERGPAIVASKPEESLMVKVVKGLGEKRMPPMGDPLTDEQIQTIETWIADGAKE